MDRGAWWATVHGVTQSHVCVTPRLSNKHIHTHTQLGLVKCLDKPWAEEGAVLFCFAVFVFWFRLRQLKLRLVSNLTKAGKCLNGGAPGLWHKFPPNVSLVFTVFPRFLIQDKAFYSTKSSFFVCALGKQKYLANSNCVSMPITRCFLDGSIW